MRLSNGAGMVKADAHMARSNTWVARRFRYYGRLLPAYLFRLNSQLTFWHGPPEANPDAGVERLGQYYMKFAQKADYPGPFDSQGVPLLDYRGQIGKQYNPIAIAQYGLGNYNRYSQTGDQESRGKFLLTADWLVEHLEPNLQGISVWHHYFDFEYRDTLKAPWYSGLAQGQGVSVLVRAYQDTGNSEYLEAAHQAFKCFLLPVDCGGVIWEWSNGDIWFEEYIVDPPTHILNGFIWAMWGVYDYVLATGDQQASQLFQHAVESLKSRLCQYDWRHWSLYELSNSRMKMLASPFYHRLHIVQFRAMARLIGPSILDDFCRKWEEYSANRWYSKRALAYKLVFKLLYY